jgi:hypothetical protein
MEKEKYEQRCAIKKVSQSGLTDKTRTSSPQY